MELDDHHRLRQAGSLRLLCHRHGALFIVNDRIDIALAVQADGVHLGQGDLPTAVARRLMGPDRVDRSQHPLPSASCGKLSGRVAITSASVR